MSSVLEFQRLFFVSSCVTWPPISRRSRSRSSLFVDYSLNRNSVNRFLACLRERMAEQCELEHPFRGTVEVDESYFGPRRVASRARLGVELARKRSSLVSASGMARFTPRSSKIVQNRRYWPRLVVKWTFARSFTSTDLRATTAWSTWATRNSYGSIIQQTNSVAAPPVAITSTANWLVMGFWGYANTQLAWFRGMNPSTFYLYLNECEFRFNHRGQNLYKVLLILCRTHPLS